MIYLVLGKLFIKTNISNLKDFSEIAIIGFIYSSFLALLINIHRVIYPPQINRIMWIFKLFFLVRNMINLNFFL